MTDAVGLPRPPHIKGKSTHIYVDRPLVAEILGLWQAGIETIGCCSGHNRFAPYICVAEKDIPRMKAMGYQVQPDPFAPFAQDSFVPKSNL
jgi:hypothetical protein